MKYYEFVDIIMINFDTIYYLIYYDNTFLIMNLICIGYSLYLSYIDSIYID